MSPQRYLDVASTVRPAAFLARPGIGQYSKDLAFELYTTVPEPTTCLMLASGFAWTSPKSSPPGQAIVGPMLVAFFGGKSIQFLIPIA